MNVTISNQIVLAIIIFVALVGLTTQCKKGTTFVDREVNRQSSFETASLEDSREDLSVYAAVISKVTKLDNNRYVVIKETTHGETLPSSSLSDVVAAIEKLPSRIIDEKIVLSYKNRNLRKSFIEGAIKTGKDPPIVSNDKIANTPYADWTTIRFSRAGFDSQKSRTLVYYTLYSGPKSAVGEFVTLEKINGKWEVAEVFNLWTS